MSDTGGVDTPAGRLQALFEGHRLTPTQRRIAHSMVRRAADVPFLSSVELAELAGVSQPSVTRFAVALGFDGYPALRRHLREVAPAEQSAASASYNEYQQAVEAEIENLRHLAEILADPRPVQRAGRLLAASRPLPVLGLRAAASQAYGFAYFAAKVHPDVRLLNEGGTMIHDRIDAAVRGDDRAQALAWVEDLDAFAAGTALPWAQAAAAFGRAMSAEHDDAGASRVTELFDLSLAHHGHANRPYDRARVQLAYGEFLRRNLQRVDARSQLRAALETFEDLHAGPLAERASQELRASGETARKRDPSTALNLTPMELKVADLVSQGMSNKDVAAQCWVSPRTVAFHLRNVFTKTGITSRGELAHLELG